MIATRKLLPNTNPAPGCARLARRLKLITGLTYQNVPMHELSNWNDSLNAAEDQG